MATTTTTTTTTLGLSRLVSLSVCLSSSVYKIGDSRRPRCDLTRRRAPHFTFFFHFTRFLRLFSSSILRRDASRESSRVVGCDENERLNRERASEEKEDASLLFLSNIYDAFVTKVVHIRLVLGAFTPTQSWPGAWRRCRTRLC